MKAAFPHHPPGIVITVSGVSRLKIKDHMSKYMGKYDNHKSRRSVGLYIENFNRLSLSRKNFNFHFNF